MTQISNHARLEDLQFFNNFHSRIKNIVVLHALEDKRSLEGFFCEVRFYFENIQNLGHWPQVTTSRTKEDEDLQHTSDTPHPRVIGGFATRHRLSPGSLKIKLGPWSFS